MQPIGIVQDWRCILRHNSWIAYILAPLMDGARIGGLRAALYAGPLRLVPFFVFSLFTHHRTTFMLSQTPVDGVARTLAQVRWSVAVDPA